MGVNSNSNFDSTNIGYNAPSYNFGDTSVQVPSLTSTDVSAKDTTQESQAQGQQFFSTGTIQLTPPANLPLTPQDLQTMNNIFNGTQPVNPEVINYQSQGSTIDTSAYTDAEKTDVETAEAEYGDEYVSAALASGVTPEQLQSNAASIDSGVNTMLNTFFSTPPGSNLSQDDKLQVALSILAPNDDQITTPADSAVASAVSTLTQQMAQNPSINLQPSQLPSGQEIAQAEDNNGINFVNAALLNGVSPNDLEQVATSANQETATVLNNFLSTPPGSGLTANEQVQVLFQVLTPDSDSTPSSNLAAAITQLRQAINSDTNLPSWMALPTPPTQQSSSLPGGQDSPTGQMMQQLANLNDSYFMTALNQATINGQPLTALQTAQVEYAHYFPEAASSLPPELQQVLSNCGSQLQQVYGFGSDYTPPTNFETPASTYNGAFATNLALALSTYQPPLTQDQMVSISMYAQNPSGAPAADQPIIAKVLAEAVAATRVEYPGLPSNWQPSVFPVFTVQSMMVASHAANALNMVAEQVQIAQTYISNGGGNVDYLSALTAVSTALNNCRNSLNSLEADKANIGRKLSTLRYDLQNQFQEGAQQYEKHLESLAAAKAKAGGWKKHLITALTCVAIMIAAALVAVATGGLMAGAVMAMAVAYCVDTIQADARGTTSETTRAFTDMDRGIEKACPGEAGKILATMTTFVVLAAVAAIDPGMAMQLMFSDSNSLSMLVQTCAPNASPAEQAKILMAVQTVLIVAMVVGSKGTGLMKRAGSRLSKLLGTLSGAAGISKLPDLLKAVGSATMAASKAAAEQTKLILSRIQDPQAIQDAIMAILDAAKNKGSDVTQDDVGSSDGAAQTAEASATKSAQDAQAASSNAAAAAAKVIKAQDKVSEGEQSLATAEANFAGAMVVTKAKQALADAKGELAAGEKSAQETKEEASKLAQVAQQAADFAKEARSSANDIASKAPKSLAEQAGSGLNSAWKTYTNQMRNYTKNLAEGEKAVMTKFANTALGKTLGITEESRFSTYLYAGMTAMTTGLQISEQGVNIQNDELDIQIAKTQEQLDINNIEMNTTNQLLQQVINNLNADMSNMSDNIVTLGSDVGDLYKEWSQAATKVSSINMAG